MQTSPVQLEDSELSIEWLHQTQKLPMGSIPEKSYRRASGENFILFDSGVNDPSQIVIFRSETSGCFKLTNDSQHNELQH